MRVGCRHSDHEIRHSPENIELVQFLLIIDLSSPLVFGHLDNGFKTHDALIHIIEGVLQAVHGRVDSFNLIGKFQNV